MVVWNDEESTPHTHTALHRGQVELHLVGLSVELGPIALKLLGGEKRLLHCQKPYYLR